MTWHRADGAHPTGDGAERVAREPVTPAPMGVARAIVQGARAATVSAGAAAAVLLLGTLVAGILLSTLDGPADFDLAARGTMASLAILVLACALGEPLRIAAERRLLLRDALRAPEGATPPAVERSALHEGPHGPLLGAAITGIVVGGVCLPIGLLLAADDREALLARILVPTIAALLLAGGIALVRSSRRTGAGRARWTHRVDSASGRWGRAILPVPRAHAQRRYRVLELTGLVLQIGVYVFVAGIFLRQPGMLADPISWDDRGERTVDGLLVVGSVTIVACTALALAIHGGLLLSAAVRDARTVRALERGERVRLEHIDAVLVDRGPLERASVVVGVVGWLLASYGWAPTFMVGIESADEVAGIRWLTILSLPGLALVALAWLLGAIGAARLRARRARVQRVLLRDPLPAEDASGTTDRRADAVRDVVLLSERPGG